MDTEKETVLSFGKNEKIEVEVQVDEYGRLHVRIGRYKTSISPDRAETIANPILDNQ